jgi:hypothetical protein
MDILVNNRLQNLATCNSTQQTAITNLTTCNSTQQTAITDLQNKKNVEVLFSCDGWSSGSAVIPAGSRGKFTSYEIRGQIGYWSWFCSQMTFGAAGACSGACSANFAQYCCAHMSCGWIGDVKCNNGSDSWSCAGAIAWPFGCSSGCGSACSLNGFNFVIAYNPMAPNGPHSSVGKLAQFCVATSHGPGSTEFCCIGVRNSGRICMCCGADASCLTGVCFTTPDSGTGIGCCSTVTIIGYNRIIV